MHNKETRVWRVFCLFFSTHALSPPDILGFFPSTFFSHPSALFSSEVPVPTAEKKLQAHLDKQTNRNRSRNVNHSLTLGCPPFLSTGLRKY